MSYSADILGMDNFDRVMKEYMKVTSKTAVGAVNQKLYNIALKAMQLTPKASMKKVVKYWSEANTEKYKSRSRGRKVRKKKGGFKKKRAGSKVTRHPMLPRVISAQKRFTRLTPTQEMWEAVEKRQKQRKSSIAFIKSGWVPAIQAFGARVSPDFHSKPRTRVNRKLVRGKPYGKGKPARNTGSPVATASMLNSVGSYGDHAAKALSRYGKKPLRRAIDIETNDSLKYLARKMKKDAADVWRDIGGKGAWSSEKPKGSRRRKRKR
tara:strand:- start:665 stop:1459 length:795 start_codon:yes stop_codon:yes gene_type:complete